MDEDEWIDRVRVLNQRLRALEGGMSLEERKVIEAAKALLHESESWNQADLVADVMKAVEALQEVE